MSSAFKAVSKKVAKLPKMIAAYERKANGRHKAGNGKAPVPPGRHYSRAEQVIPFDDAEVSDF